MKQQILNQMKMNGYKIEETDNAIFATRADAAPVMIRFIDGTVMFYSQYNSNLLSRSDSSGFKSYINDLNQSVAMTRFSTNPEISILSFDANYMGNYDEYTFAQFIRLWEYDTRNMIDNHSESFRYLSSDDELVSEYGNESFDSYATA
tara:strand:+ start:923 stop:1366 length:444 start_codon:yes stop_codon:yes gene_type:complete